MVKALGGIDSVGFLAQTVMSRLFCYFCFCGFWFLCGGGCGAFGEAVDGVSLLLDAGV